MPGKEEREGGKRLALAACTTVALYFLASTLYALVNLDAFASAKPQFLRYVLAPALVGASFLVIGLLAKPRWSRPIGIYGLSLLIGLFLFEGFLTIRQLSVHFASLGRLDQHQRAILAHEEDFVRGFTLRRLNLLAGVEDLPESMLAGFPGSTTLLCSPPGQAITYKADRYGFNNPNTVYEAPVDLMLLGDSFVEGFCLKSGEDLASRLRQRGPNTVSMGIRGNGPLIELATVGRYGPLLKPAHVVMAFFEGNDWENLERSLNEPWLRAALRANARFGSPEGAAQTVDKARSVMEQINKDDVTMADLVARRSFLRNFAALQMTGTSLGLLYPKISVEIPEFQQALRRARELTESWGGCFSLLYIPRVDRFVGVFPSDAGFDQLLDLVLDAAAAERVPVIDLNTAFHRQPQPARMYAPDAHFSREGTVLAAETILRSLATHRSSSGERCARLTIGETAKSAARSPEKYTRPGSGG
ncbi:GDSL-type esterase/lipase family protein [Chelativorans salis]|uniref:GDSL-type esterase/lipase family protein n=1 Tax=Chelativorans salis TaxID=2978478 RepID=A0ABT2LU75_9HYPH|nr:GDSL-type esterase/lipase family protein [Chelativorans sp. EGI FJ00035]MCT7376923.1 GDSL-type esterase/lipase family protein [Chelativorans sp. EGI FJ00035]